MDLKSRLNVFEHAHLPFKRLFALKKLSFVIIIQLALDITVGIAVRAVCDRRILEASPVALTRIKGEVNRPFSTKLDRNFCMRNLVRVCSCSLSHA